MWTHSPVVRTGETKILCFVSVVSQKLELVQVRTIYYLIRPCLIVANSWEKIQLHVHLE